MCSFCKSLPLIVTTYFEKKFSPKLGIAITSTLTTKLRSASPDYPQSPSMTYAAVLYSVNVGLHYALSIISSPSAGLFYLYAESA